MIRICREQKGMSQEELGQKVQVTRQTIAAWEKKERVPTIEQLGRVAKALGVSVDLLIGKRATVEPTLLFRADVPSVLSDDLRRFLTRKAQDYAVVEKVTGSFPVIPESRPVMEYDFFFVESVAREIRDWLGVEEAPLGDALSLLEAKGIKIVPQALPNEVSGFSAYTNELGGVIFINSSHPTERQFFTALHELAHLVFHRKEYDAPGEPVRKSDPREKLANHIAGAVLLPRTLVEGELKSYRNRWIPEPVLGDMKYRYSTSMRTILYRAEQIGIISKKQMGVQIGKLNSRYGKDDEGYELTPPKALRRLNRLVYRALFDQKITASRAAEILGVPLLQVREELSSWYEGVTH